MRLGDFILQNIESILAEWEAFARSIWPGGAAGAGAIDPAELRDHAAEILRATARDMTSAQTEAQRSEKSKGEGGAGAGSAGVTRASERHAVARVGSGFDLKAVVAEYRALRASVLRLWRASGPRPDVSDVDDLTRFNESIDQSLTETVDSYTSQIARSRQMFLAILGHDLRDPLNAMSMSAEVLQHTGARDTETREMAENISTSALSMGQLVNDLLDFTATGLGGTLPVSLAHVDLKAICQEVITEKRAAYPKRTLRFDAQGDLTGQWDAARLRQVVSNLLGNAIQHGAETGPVELSVRDEGSEVHLSVRNQGPPIPHDALVTIFEPMARGPLSPHSRQQRRRGSVGLGLYIARAVVIAHGGTIDVSSSTETGTVFTVRLPRQPATS